MTDRRSDFPPCQDKGRVEIARPGATWRVVSAACGREARFPTFGPEPGAAAVSTSANVEARSAPGGWRENCLRMFSCQLRGKGEGRTLEAADREDAIVCGAAHAATGLKRPARGTGRGGSPAHDDNRRHGERALSSKHARRDRRPRKADTVSKP